MSEQVETLVTNQVAYISEATPNTTQAVTAYTDYYWLKDWSDFYGYILFKFPQSAIPSRAKLISIQSRMSVDGYVALSVPTTTPDLGTVTWNTRPSGERIAISSSNMDSAALIKMDTDLTAVENSLLVKKFLQLGYLFAETRFGVSRAKPGVYSSTSYGSQYNGWLTIDVTYDDSVTVTSQVTQINSKTSGYINPENSQKFEWTFEPDGDYWCLADFTQTSATFYWRAGTSGDWTAVSASGSTQNVTIAANTFPSGDSAGTMQWYVEVTDNYSNTTQTPVYTVTTADSLISAAPTAPINTVEDGSAPIRLSWGYSSPDGTAPTGFKIEYKDASHNDWATLITQTSADLYYDAPVGSFDAGSVQWRVSLKNQANQYGNPSSAASFVNVSAPAAPAVQVEAVPFATINWTSTGQEAWKLLIDGVEVAQEFGSARSYTLKNYLEDGTHTVEVLVQGVYGLWSEPGINNFTILNTSANTIVLSAAFGYDAALSWTTASVTTDFLIYRDGVLIGQTNNTSFIDFAVLGSHEWQIVNRLSDGNYDISNRVTGTLATERNLIADIENGSWLELKLTEKSNGIQSFSKSRQYSLRHFSGAEYPVAEVSPFTDMAASYDAAFTPDDSGAAALESLFGREVILKSRRGNVIIGVLSSFSKLVGDFYTVYTFTLQRIHYEDFRDETNS